MSEPLFAAFLASYAFLQDSYCKVATNFPSVLEAVRNSFRRAVDTNRHSIDLRIDDSLRERFSGEPDKTQPQSADHRLLRLKVDCHPDRSGVKWKQAMVLGRGPKANDSSRYALTGENDLVLKV